MMIRGPNPDLTETPKYEPKFTNYTALKACRADEYLASYEDVPYRGPPPLKGEKGKDDINKYCRFHDDYGHETNECMHLKDEIEFLLRSGKLRKFKAPKEGGRGDHNPRFKKQRSPPMEPTLVDFTIDTIFGGSYLAGESSKSGEKYARTKHKVTTADNCMSVEEKSSRRQGEEAVSFTEEDSKHVRYPHTNPL